MASATSLQPVTMVMPPTFLSATYHGVISALNWIGWLVVELLKVRLVRIVWPRMARSYSSFWSGGMLGVSIISDLPTTSRFSMKRCALSQKIEQSITRSFSSSTTMGAGMSPTSSCTSFNRPCTCSSRSISRVTSREKPNSSATRPLTMRRSAIVSITRTWPSRRSMRSRQWKPLRPSSACAMSVRNLPRSSMW